MSTSRTEEIEVDIKQEMHDRLDRFVEKIENCQYRYPKSGSHVCSLLDYSRCGFLKCPEI